MRTASASGRKEMTDEFEQEEPSLVILDLRLGQEDGLDLLREIRSHSDVPVIITTGHRRDEIDRVVGLELGADDYLTKPFGLRELLARIRAVLRRREAAGRAAPQREPDQVRYRFGSWQLDRHTRRLSDPDGAPVALTKGEFALLVAFSRCAATAADARVPAASHPHPRGCVRPQHRRAGPAPAPQAGEGFERAERHPDRARCGLRLRPAGGAALGLRRQILGVGGREFGKSSSQYSCGSRVPAARNAISAARSSTRRIFPEIVLGSSANSRRRTRLNGARTRRRAGRSTAPSHGPVTGRARGR